MSSGVPGVPAGIGAEAPGKIPTVLVVDDVLVDRHLVGGLLEEELGWRVKYAENGSAALAAMEHEPPSLVVTDLQMPVMDGLELVETIRRRHPAVPVILVTAHGSEEIAIQALRQGAASYVSKKRLVRDLVKTLEQVLEAAQAEQHHQRLGESLLHLDCQFLLENDPALIRALIAHLRAYLAGMRVGDETSRVRTSIALEEALTNAIYHGNLELSSALRQSAGQAYWQLAEERRRGLPYRDRRIRVTAKLTRTEVTYVIRDDGPGFDPSRLPDPTDPVNLERMSGRGTLLIRTFMDHVHYNETGNEITMSKRCGGGGPTPS